MSVPASTQNRVVLCSLQEINFPSPVIYVPYVCGALRAYAEQFDDIRTRWAFGEPIWQIQDTASMLEAIGDADVVGLSCYVWNTRNTLRFAQAIKAHRPDTLVICGGPHIPNGPSDFLQQHPYVDALIHGEGETAFVALLRARSEGRSLLDVPSLSTLVEGQQVFTERAPRLTSIEYPSPFLQGYFETMVTQARALDQYTFLMASLETNRGCPYSCAFCDWGMATMSRLRQRSEATVRAEMEWVAEHKLDAIILSDANFGILPRDLGLTEHLAQLKRERGFPHSFFPTGFAKNNKDRAFAVHKTIIDNQLDPTGINVNFSLQATSQDTLDAINRQNIPLDNYRKMADLYGSNGYRLTPDLILPLPGETLTSFCEGYADLATWPQVARIRVYPCSILPNAPMADPAYRTKWGLQTRMLRIGKRDPLRRPSVIVEDEFIESIYATAHMPEGDHLEAKVWVHWLNAWEISGVLRPLRIHAMRQRSMACRAFYQALLDWFRSSGSLLAGCLQETVETLRVSEYSDEIAWAGEVAVGEGRCLKPYKALIYTALTQAEAFAESVQRFAAEVLELGDPLTSALLAYQSSLWTTPALEPIQDSVYEQTHEHDWLAYLDGDALAPLTRPTTVRYARPVLWSGYRGGKHGWVTYALADTQLDTWCVLGQAGWERLDPEKGVPLLQQAPAEASIS